MGLVVVGHSLLQDASDHTGLRLCREWKSGKDKNIIFEIFLWMPATPFVPTPLWDAQVKENELEEQPAGEKKKLRITPRCYNYNRSAGCPLGDRCKFLHK